MDLTASGSEIEAGDGRVKLLILEMKQASYFKIISFLMTYTVVPLVFGVFLFWWQGI
jgi:hypothetical protein